MMNKTCPDFWSQSPWLDASKPNIYLEEFKHAKYEEPNAYFKPIEPFRWIFQNKGEDLFLRGLARLAPMFPVIAYKGGVAGWLSPPPSGFGNAIYIVMGHDASGVMRLAGGNYFTEPNGRSGSLLNSSEFFEQFENGDSRKRFQLLKDSIEMSICADDEALMHSVRRECEHFHTMPVYVSVLTESGSIFHACKAVIEGEKPADFSYEFIGEIK